MYVSAEVEMVFMEYMIMKQAMKHILFYYFKYTYVSKICHFCVLK